MSLFHLLNLGCICYFVVRYPHKRIMFKLDKYSVSYSLQWVKFQRPVSEYWTGGRLGPRLMRGSGATQREAWTTLENADILASLLSVLWLITWIIRHLWSWFHLHNSSAVTIQPPLDSCTHSLLPLFPKVIATTLAQPRKTLLCSRLSTSRSRKSANYQPQHQIAI